MKLDDVYVIDPGKEDEAIGYIALAFTDGSTYSIPFQWEMDSLALLYELQRLMLFLREPGTCH